MTARMIAMEEKMRMTAGELLCSLQRRTGSGCKVKIMPFNIVSIEGKHPGDQYFFPGLTDPTTEETFEASEEDCARACYYSKR